MENKNDRYKGHEFVAVTEDFDGDLRSQPSKSYNVTFHKSVTFISSYNLNYISNLKLGYIYKIALYNGV